MTWTRNFAYLLLGFAASSAYALENGSARAAKAEFFVATSGNDQDPGTKGKPFATLERARDAVRTAKKPGLPKGGITVYLQGGSYERATTFTLGPEDSGAAEAPVVYRAIEGEEVRLSGGREIPPSTFKPVADQAIFQRLSPVARDKVLQANLKELGISDFGAIVPSGFLHDIVPSEMELFYNDKPMILARWPNTGYAYVDKILDRGSFPRKGDRDNRGARFIFPDDRIKRWAGADDLWLDGYWTWDWADEKLAVKTIDPRTNEVAMAGPHMFGFTEGQFNQSPRAHFIALNLLEELDQPEEWFLDRKTGMLYFWPPDPVQRGRAVVSILETPLVTIGDASDVILRGLTFECSRGCGVEIVGGTRNLAAGCTFRSLGTVAVEIGGMISNLAQRVYEDEAYKGEDAGTLNGMTSCDLYDIGYGGVLLGGGDRKTLKPGGNFVTNCEIHDYSRRARTNRGAAFIYGAGNRVAHCRIHDAQHTAVFMWGNDHLLELNEVYRVLLETHDAGAFYDGRDPGARGKIVRNNFFHHIGSESGLGTTSIYLDDGSCGTLVTGNVFYKAGIPGAAGFGAVHINGGKDNIVENNMFIACQTAMSVAGWGEAGWRDFIGGVGNHASIARRLYDAVDIRKPPYSTRYPELADLDKNAGRNRAFSNAMVNCENFLHLDSNSPEQDLKDNFETKADPGFVNAAAMNFTLTNKSIIYQKIPGFKPIPFAKIGLYKDEYRAKLPATK